MPRGNPLGRDPGYLETYGGRGQLEWVGDGKRVLLTAEVLTGDNGMANQFISSANKTGPLSPAAVAALPPGDSFYRHYYTFDGYERQDTGTLTGRVRLDFPVRLAARCITLRTDKEQLLAAARALRERADAIEAERARAASCWRAS